MHFVIHGQTPAQKNSKQMAYNRSTGKMFPVSSAVTKKWKRQAIKELKALLAAGEVTPITEPVSLTLVLHVQDNRPRDNDNMLSSIQDLLVELGVIEKDNWQRLNPVTVECAGIDRDNPRAEVWLDE